MKTRFYGDGGTYHNTTFLDIETKNGKVVAVWFRCQTLPFKQVEADNHRAEEMKKAYKEYTPPEIHGLTLLDK
jgi:hypothetical protein